MTTLDLIEYSQLPGDLSQTEQEVIAHWEDWGTVLAEAWKERPQSQQADEYVGDQDEAEGDEETPQRYLQLLNNRLKAGRYVGTICRDDVTINIWPRVFRSYLVEKGLTVEKDEKHRGVMTRNMLRWASTAAYFNLNPSTGGASPPEDLSSFFEAYLWMFSDFAYDLLARQPYWQYQSEIEEGDVLRGRLVMNQYINDCLARGRWQRLVYEHEPFVFDNLLNRIIKRTCKLAQAFCESDTVRDKLGEILFELEEVEDVFCTARDCDRVYLNRLHTEYQMVLDNCRMILATCQADNSGRDMRRFCFLLPMDRLFEEYLRVLAQEAIQTDNVWKLVDGNGIPLALGCHVKTKKPRSSFNLIHDLLFQREYPSGVVIADAKWKDREKNEKYGNFGVSQNDMYQMVAYAHGRGSTEVRLLYPAMGEALTSSHIATLTTKPGGISAGSPINVQVHELKIHAYPVQNLAVGDQFTKVEDDIKRDFGKMLSPELSAELWAYCI